MYKIAIVVCEKCLSKVQTNILTEMKNMFLSLYNLKIFQVCLAAAVSAEADADAALLYGAYGYAGLAGAYGAYPYAAAYGAYPYAYGAYYGKRSADAEPEADADAALLYGAYGYGGYGLGYAGYGYGAYPYAYGGYGVSNAANTVGIAGVAPAALPAVAGGYAGAGRYVANSAGVVHVA